MQESATIINEGVPGILVQGTIEGAPSEEVLETTDSSRKKKASSKVSKKSKPLNKADRHIWGVYILLIIVAVVELFSASSREVVGSNVYLPLIRHFKFLFIGFCIILIMQRMHYKWFRKMAWPLAFLSLGLLIYASKWGLNINGAQRAIYLGPLGTFQPAEMVKMTCMLLLATILAKHQMRGGVTTKGVVYSAIVVIVFSAITWRNGLTNMVLIMGVSLAMFIIGGIRWSKIFIVVALYGMAGGMYYITQHSEEGEEEKPSVEISGNLAESAAVSDNDAVDRTETRHNRVKEWLEGVHPEDKINDRNRQAMLAHFAQANGGVSGQGLGKSRENARLPLAFSDYIFAIIVEETGLVGGFIVLMIYLALIARAGNVARQCSRAFPALLIMGCAVLITFQALIHMAIVTGLAPVSGQPLPLISKGGTSVLVMSAVIGMMLSVSRYAVRNGNKKQIKAEMNELPDDLKSENPSMIEK